MNNVSLHGHSSYAKRPSMLSSFGRGTHVLQSGDNDLDNVLRKLLRPFSLTTIYFKRILYLHAKRLSKGTILTQYRRKEKEFKRNNIQLTPFFADNTSHVAEAISLFSSFSPAFHSKSIYFSSIFPRNKRRYVAKYNKFVANASNVHRKAPKLFVKSQKSLYLCTSD